METASHGDLFTLAKLAEQAERYEDVVHAMKRLVVMAKVLSTEERNLLSVGYKNVIGARRTTWRLISNSEEREDARKGKRLLLLKQYREKVEREIRDISAGILELLEEHLIPNAEESEEKVFFYKMQGDYYRYLSEIEGGDVSNGNTMKAFAAYKSASDFSSDLQATHPIRLGLALNFSVFYHDIHESPERALELTQKAYNDAKGVLEAVDGEGRYRESTLIMQLLRDNLELWNSEIQ